MALAGRLVVGTLAFWAVMSASALANPVVRSGPLEASVSGDPWQLELTDRGGNPVLAEHPGTGSGPSGTLGFRTATGWSHATRIADSTVEDGIFTAQLETTDPLRTISLELRPDGQGVIALDARIQGPTAGTRGDGHRLRCRRRRALPRLRRALEPGRPGRRRGRELRRGRSLPGPGVRRDRGSSCRRGASATVARTLRTSRFRGCFPIEGYGVLVDNPETSTFRLGSDGAGAWSVEVDSAPPGEAGAETAPPVDRFR